MNLCCEKGMEIKMGEWREWVVCAHPLIHPRKPPTQQRKLPLERGKFVIDCSSRREPFVEASWVVPGGMFALEKRTRPSGATAVGVRDDVPLISVPAQISVSSLVQLASGSNEPGEGGRGARQDFGGQCVSATSAGGLGHHVQVQSCSGPTRATT
jgi:hypothetical protein